MQTTNKKHPSKNEPTIDELLAAIARETLHIDTLETRKSDSLDVHDVAVWSVKDALEAAYRAGLAAGQGMQAMKVLGITTIYDGVEFRYLRGYTVRIVAVLKNALRADYDPDKDGQYITEEHELARAGGVTADDRVGVRIWLPDEKRFSYVACDPRAVDLACFASLKR